MWTTIANFLMRWFVVPLFTKGLEILHGMYKVWKQGKIDKENKDAYEEALKSGNEDERIDAATDMLNGVPRGNKK